MSIKIIPTPLQASGQFNGGAILENKPIGFPREGGTVSPYSNLFYWAHAWSDKGSTIGEHPHKGFEILSFVIEGEIEHYDNKHQGWKKLKKGDAQIIRAGNGITHAEKLNPGAHMFQIWLDPNLDKTLRQPASYNDYSSDQFPLIQKGGITTKTYKGADGPIEMDAVGVEIKEIQLTEGTHSLSLDPNLIHSFYLIKGNVSVDKKSISPDDFFIVTEQEKLSLEAIEPSTLFLISSLAQIPYQTYASMPRRF